MRKGKAAALAAAAVILAASGAFVSFWLTRPSVAFVTDLLPRDYVSRLERPGRLTASWRCRTVTADVFDGRAEAVIDFTKDGIGTELPAFRPFLPPVEIFSSVLPELAGEHVTYVYDEDDAGAAEFLEILEGMFPDLGTVPFSGTIDRADFSVLRGGLREGTVLLVPDLYPAMEFIRSLDSPRLALDWIDAAALETAEPEFVAVPDWDAVISDMLQ